MSRHIRVSVCICVDVDVDLYVGLHLYFAHKRTRLYINFAYERMHPELYPWTHAQCVVLPLSASMSIYRHTAYTGTAVRVRHQRGGGAHVLLYAKPQLHDAHHLQLRLLRRH